MILTVTLNPSVDVWLHVSSLKVGGFHRVKAATQSAGGKGVNVTRVVRALGGKSTALIPGGAPVRINYKIIAETPHSSTEINLPGAALSRRMLGRLQARLFALMQKARVLVLAGSLPAGVPAGIYRRWIAKAGKRGVLTALDASGEALKLSLPAKPWLIKPNREEAQALLGSRIGSLAQAVSGARRMLALGAGQVLLSLDSGGALLAEGAAGRFWHAKPPAVRAATTVGSGDALLAGFLVAKGRRFPSGQALRYAVAVATAAVLRPAGQCVRPGDAAALLGRVRLRSL